MEDVVYDGAGESDGRDRRVVASAEVEKGETDRVHHEWLNKQESRRVDCIHDAGGADAETMV